MNFFENTRKPQGFGGKLMTKMMNIGHAKLSQWGFSNISVNPDAAVLDVGCGGGANIVAWLGKCGNGHVTGMDYSEVSVAESQKLNATNRKKTHEPSKFTGSNLKPVTSISPKSRDSPKPTR